MELNKYVNIILSQLNLDKLKWESKLEYQFNSNDEVTTKIDKSLEIIRELAMIDIMINKFVALTTSNEQELKK
jgi:hypothetical protein